MKPQGSNDGDHFLENPPCTWRLAHIPSFSPHCVLTEWEVIASFCTFLGHLSSSVSQALRASTQLTPWMTRRQLLAWPLLQGRKSGCVAAPKGLALISCLRKSFQLICHMLCGSLFSDHQHRTGNKMLCVPCSPPFFFSFSSCLSKGIKKSPAFAFINLIPKQPHDTTIHYRGNTWKSQWLLL